ncbi:MAG: hypothetical protein IKZ43_05015 [Acidaminococcaceae bacterium]|nr:hypothetical protein [Acidaminococcaceae bacterium]
MRNIFQLKIKYAGKITAMLAFSFFTVGCHTGSEPASVHKTAVKKETAGRASESPLRIITKDKAVTEAILNNKQKKPVSFSNDKRTNNDAAARRDPFALPAELQETQKFPMYNRKDSGNATPFTNPAATNQRATTCNNQQTLQQSVPKATEVQSVVPPYSQEPCVAGIFDNGKEKFALVRWQKVQGIFRCGEQLGNGYYVKEITANSVLLCPDQDAFESDAVKLVLR